MALLVIVAAITMAVLYRRKLSSYFWSNQDKSFELPRINGDCDRSPGGESAVLLHVLSPMHDMVDSMSASSLRERFSKTRRLSTTQLQAILPPV